MSVDPEVNARRVAYLLLILTTVCFGGTWVAVKVAVDAIPPVTLAVTRFMIASAVLRGWSRRTASGGWPLALADVPLLLGMGLTAVAG